MKIYFVRHGESKANLLHEFSNRGFKHGLTERGLHQAKQLAQNLHGLSFAQIYSSPIKRAFQTAEILGRHLHCSIEISDALREFDCGVLEGKSDPQSWEIYNQVFQQWVEGKWASHIPGGESHLDIQTRFIPFIEKISRNYMDENILLVGHGGLFRCMFPLVMSNLDVPTVSQLPIHHTEPIIAETRSEGLFCLQWGGINFD